jgi:1-acyl-sn-glycerol-3-phosphate acyltransferase
LSEHTADQINYRYYLGDNYRQEYKDPVKDGGKVSTYVCNHCSAIDIIVLLSALKGKCAFVAGDHTLAVPGLCRIIKAIGCITMPMGGSKEALERIA